MNEKLRRDSLVLGIRHNAWCAQRAPARRKAAYSSARVTEIEFASTISATKNKVRQVRTRMLGQLIGHDLPQVEKAGLSDHFFSCWRRGSQPNGVEKAGVFEPLASVPTSIPTRTLQYRTTR